MTLHVERPLDQLPEAVLFDLDGTLYRGNEMIAGADRLISSLLAQHIPCWYITNNSTRSAEEVAAHLQAMNIPADADRVLTSAMATADYVKRIYPEENIYMIGEQGLHDALQSAGLSLVSGEEPAGVVVQGLDRGLNYDKLSFAVRHLLNGAAFVMTNPDKLLPTAGGFIPGAGSLGALLQAATQITPTIIGKPSTIMMDYAFERTGSSRARTWVIGDNPQTDLAAARDAGCPIVLVLTGLCTSDNWQQLCGAALVQPDAVFTNLDEVIAQIAQMS